MPASLRTSKKMQRCDDDAWHFAMCDGAWLFCKPSCDDDWLCSCLQICMCAKSNFQNELRKTDLMIPEIRGSEETPDFYSAQTDV